MHFFKEELNTYQNVFFYYAKIVLDSLLLYVVQ